MPEAVIVDAIRTPIGRAMKGSLKTVRADELAALPIRTLIERNPDVDFAQTNDVLMGAASGVGEQGYNVGRNAALLAGLDHHVPGCTVNRFCASSLMTIRMASHAIRAGEGDQYIAAGVEAVSRAGLGAGMMEEAKSPALDGSEGSLYDVYIPMGMTAENVAERCSVTREQQDEWAVISQSRAVEARDSGHFDAEIVPVRCPPTRRPIRRATKSTSPRMSSAATMALGPGRRWKSWVSSSPPSGPRGRSRPETLARSTTAPPRSWSCPTRRPRDGA
jgi:acetyl-CoA C-acetyltransferase